MTKPPVVSHSQRTRENNKQVYKAKTHSCAPETDNVAFYEQRVNGGVVLSQHEMSDLSQTTILIICGRCGQTETERLQYKSVFDQKAMDWLLTEHSRKKC